MYLERATSVSNSLFVANRWLEVQSRFGMQEGGYLPC